MSKQAVLYRMVTDEHVCPFGLKSRALLHYEGYEVEDHLLTSREETDAFKAKYHVETTPQTFIDGERVGGYDRLKEHFDLATETPETSYTPVIAIFATTFLMAIAWVWNLGIPLLSMTLVSTFVALSMGVLAILKLRDLSAFSNQFLGYDLLAQRFVPYAFVYPFAEAISGIGMLANLIWVAPIALFIGTVGAVSVVKAVYIDKRELKCACVGGDSNVPLGLVSLTENLMMVAMGLWMLLAM
jgi:glutaredoxin